MNHWSEACTILYGAHHLNIYVFCIIFVYTGSSDSSVGIATDYGLFGRGSIPSRGKRFFFSPQRPRPTQPPIQWLPGALSPGIKRQVREADHSPPVSAEVKNGAIHPLSHNSSWSTA
jgi:hypothetical protein